MIPVVLNNPESMAKVRVMAVKDDSEKALKVLHRIGVLHVEKSRELTPIDRAAIEREHREVSEYLGLIDNVLGYLPQEERLSLEEDVEVIYTRPFSEISDEVTRLHDKLNKLNQRIIKLDGDAQRSIELTKYLEPLATQNNFRLKDLNFFGDYLFSRVFVLPTEMYRNLRDRLGSDLFESVAVPVEDETVFYAIAKVENQRTIESLVAEARGKTIPIPDEDLTLRDFLAAINNRIDNLEQALTKLHDELRSAVGQDLNKLALLREALSAERERLLVLGMACEAKYLTLIEGWIPESNIEPVISEVRQNIEYVFVDTRRPEPSEEPPSKLKNPTGFRPFQVIVNLFGTPRYREWDPTPIIAYSFALFFGIMVCDVVYALCIMLLSRLLLSKFVDDPESDNFRLFQRLIYACGGMALIGGLLTGQYLGDIYTFLGFESIALVRQVNETLQDPLSFIILALGIGFVHVNIGHILAFIRGIKEKNGGLVLSKVGLFTLQLGLPAIINSLLSVDFGFSPQVYPILSYVMLTGILLVIIANIIQSGGLGAILWLFDITGLLGDVMSYARLAGVGLATFYLASTFNMMAELFRHMIPGIAGVVIGGTLAIVIIVFGHLVNMALTAIAGFIHSLRLCFVEFLFKFYEGGGREYSPFKLRKRAIVRIGAKS